MLSFRAKGNSSSPIRSLKFNIRVSSNGRTTVSGTVYRGSNPCTRSKSPLETYNFPDALTSVTRNYLARQRASFCVIGGLTLLVFPSPDRDSQRYLLYRPAMRLRNNIKELRKLAKKVL